MGWMEEQKKKEWMTRYYAISPIGFELWKSRSEEK